jgi:cobalamin biosynthesis protein CobD/CbiB
MGRRADVTRRWLGAIFLLAAVGMLLAGETVLRERFSSPVFLVFWLICLVFACLALRIAFLDVSAIRRRTREERRALFENTLQEIARRKRSKPEEHAEPDERAR